MMICPVTFIFLLYPWIISLSIYLSICLSVSYSFLLFPLYCSFPRLFLIAMGH